MDERKQFQNKEEALAAFEDLVNKRPSPNSDQSATDEWYEKYDSIVGAAKDLGAMELDFFRVESKVTKSQEEKQTLFDNWLDNDREAITLDEWVKLRDEFGLKG